MDSIKSVAASGTFGTPITAALIKAGFDVTVISRAESQATFPEGIPVKKTEYTLENLTEALRGQDAAVCVVGPGGIPAQSMIVQAAVVAGVRRFIVNDFGWGPTVRGLPEFAGVHALRKSGWDHAKIRAKTRPGFTFTGISSGNPIDWALKTFPTMGFNPSARSAIIYDDGDEEFTGTTLQGIGQSVVGVLQHLEETKNRFVQVLSIRTTQNELLAAFEKETGEKWTVERSTTAELMAGGRKKMEDRDRGWILDLAVGQLLDKGEARCVVAPSWEESDSGLLGVASETAQEIAAKVMA